MKNKLLLSSALVGGMIAGSSAIAQTSVTGSLDIHYRAHEYSLSNGQGSRRGFGRESQLNVQNKGALNNGLNYAAGFSLEFDGNNTTATTLGAQTSTRTEASSISNENLFIDIIAGTTTFTVGVDHVQNSTMSSVPQVSNIIDNVAFGMGSLATNQIGATTKEAMYAGVVQVIPGTGITASAIYAPTGRDFGSTDQTINTASSNNSSYEVGFVGVNAFGVTGLNFHAFQNVERAAGVSVSDLRGRTYGVGYTTGAFGIGAEKHYTNRATTTQTTEEDVSAKVYGVTYAVDKNFTLGFSMLKNDKASSSINETIKSIQAGYNLGPVAVVGYVSKGTDVNYSSGNDIKELAVRLSTKF
jgi:hypothetical protein